MKTAIYIEDGVVQLVITPETKFERSSMKIFNDKPIEVEIFSGSFYDCRGGWIRQKEYYPDANLYGINRNSDDDSLILKVSNKEKK